MREQRCEDCSGTGEEWLGSHYWTQCLSCDGRGRTVINRDAVDEHWAEEGRRAAAMYFGWKPLPDPWDGESYDTEFANVADGPGQYWMWVNRDGDGDPDWFLEEVIYDQCGDAVIPDWWENVRGFGPRVATPQEMRREPTPGYVPAVRRVGAWSVSFLPKSGTHKTACAAYMAAAHRLMTGWVSSSVLRLRRRLDKLNRHAGEDYWGRVQDRLAAILRAQDRKHGGGA